MFNDNDDDVYFTDFYHNEQDFTILMINFIIPISLYSLFNSPELFHFINFWFFNSGSVATVKIWADSLVSLGNPFICETQRMLTFSLIYGIVRSSIRNRISKLRWYILNPYASIISSWNGCKNELSAFSEFIYQAKFGGGYENAEVQFPNKNSFK